MSKMIGYHNGEEHTVELTGYDDVVLISWRFSPMRYFYKRDDDGYWYNATHNSVYAHKEFSKFLDKMVDTILIENVLLEEKE